jgi:hypothetical protein
MTHLRIAITTALLALLAVSAFAQAGTTSTNPAPSSLYSAGAFLGFNHYDAPQMKGGGFFDTKIAENTYNETTLNMTSKLATVTTGVKRFFYSSPRGTVALFATAKAGVATGDGSATAVFGGGGGIKVLLAGAANKFPFLKLFSTIPNSYVSGTVDIQQINGAGVSPTFGFAIGADFK